MRILHVTYADGGGGAARAAYRLHRAERECGLESTMVVMQKHTDDPHVRQTREWFPGRNHLARRLQSRMLRSARASDPRGDRSLNLVPSLLHRGINASDADVVHLHWIHEEMISVGELARIEKALVWTLHDAWACCGTEHYPRDGDDRGADGDASSRWFDVERWTRQRKRAQWRGVPFVFVAPSHWLAVVCRQSAIGAERPVHVVPNPVLPEEFRPHDRAAARRRFGLDEHAIILLFGAHDISHPRKGLDLLVDALKALACDTGRSYELVVFGGGGMPDGLRARHLGWIGDELAQLYSAADVLLAPSRIDNLPNSVAEATACGVPTVAFRVGGLPDLVRHKSSGYLAEPFDAADFANGVRWTLAQPRAALVAAVAEQAAMLAPQPVVNAYLHAYEQAIAARRRQ